jgi:hypothetical protein
MFDPAILGEADLLVTAKSFHLPYFAEHYPGIPAYHVPQAYSQVVHRPVYAPVREEDYLCDVLYLGTGSAYKQQLLEALMAEMPDLDLMVAGSYWAGMIKDDSPLAGRLFNGIPFNCAYSELLQRARINVAFHFGPDRRGWNDMVSARTYEIPAVGGFMIHIDNKELRDSFDVGRECAAFTEVADLAETIRHYLAHPEERRQMAAAGQARAEAEHSFLHRARAIGELMARTGQRAAPAA